MGSANNGKTNATFHYWHTVNQNEIFTFTVIDHGELVVERELLSTYKYIYHQNAVKIKTVMEMGQP